MAAVVLAALVVVTLTAVAPTGAAAQPEPTVRLRLTSLSGVVGEAAGMSDLTVATVIENLGDRAVTDLTLLVEVFDRVNSRSALHVALDSGDPTGLIEDEAVDVREPSALESNRSTLVEATIPESRLGWADETGVYPIRASVLQGREVLDEVHSAVVSLAREPNVRLDTVVAWPVDAPPWRFADGSFPADLPPEIRDGGRLTGLLGTLDDRTRPRVQPLMAAHVVEDVAAMADGFTSPDGRRVPASRPATRLLTQLRRLAGAGPAPVAGPYADADLPGMLTAGFGSQASRAVAEGRRRLEVALRRRPRPETLWATTPMTHGTLEEVIVPSGVDSLVVNWNRLHPDGPDKPDTTPPGLQHLPASGVQINAVVGDPWVTDLLAGLRDTEGVAAAVQRVIAETAMIHLERPNDADRTLVMLPPPDWNPDPRIARRLATRLVGLPWLHPIGIDRLVSADEPSRAVPRLALPAGGSRGLAPEIAGDLQRARDRLAALRSALPDSVDAVGGRSWQELERMLLRVPSTWWTDTPASRADALLEAALEAVDQGLGPISLPVETQITLTDTQGTIPVTVARSAGPPIRVVVRLEAPPRIDFPQGRTRTLRLEPGSSQTISFDATAHASGRIPVTVRVLTAGDATGISLARETLVVRSTAISGTALAVLGGVILLLLAWWLYRRLNRDGEPPLTVVPDEQQTPVA